ncbi:daunorubicin resistance protein DrrA family ABC transporter ATP-binding protein [Candidatus Solirubrobacter pratensis]|uniref:daunorubicin resistance protein DrrA family ABC transporter ATP-binding protein n=1 Tax=Candidatus Solirubrobacter pratensis TaxID=1298857 RepID=UPI000419AD91|nr:daunorubicin resistance protein DrrA family ABC transporter ATP-binding protein [Candidatus Solirubrobacter pratensis]
MAYTIETGDLAKSFGKLPVLTGLDLAVEAGSVFALLGPNGAGKTTTVRILSTLLTADAGFARVAGHDVAREPVKVREALSLTGQYAAVDEVLTARENLALMARLRHLCRGPARRRVGELIERFGLQEAADRRVATYSGGMKRRLDLAMSLVSQPQVVVLDEPTTGLDPRSRRDVWDAVAELAASGATVLLTTQYLEEADRLADRIAVIDGGRVVAEGSADELKARLGDETVELFFADTLALEAAEREVGGSAEPQRLCLRVASDGSAEAIRRLLDQVGGVQRLQLHRPSLDDVFLSLTERV